ncbi:MAG: DNA topoisomerase IB [Acidobacteriota bacterium]
MTRIERICATGIRRLGKPKHFRYERANGSKVSRDDLSRIDALRIPPAWEDVCISSSAAAAVQVVGRDAAGRWQYLYHDSHVRRQDKKKFQRVIEFAESLPGMRKTVASHLRQQGLSRERVMASVLRILSMSFIRPGSQVYASENGSYGIATLQPKHVKVKGNVIILDFPGKSRVQQHRELRDRAAARVVRELLKNPGREVFKFTNGDGLFVDVKRRHINAYIKEVLGHKFTAKDFRTWAGTLVCACALARVQQEPAEGKTQKKRQLVAAVKETAEALGNTPAVCRSSYICPLIMSSFAKGQVINGHFASVKELMSYRGASLHAAERSLLRLMKQQAR